MNGKLDIEKLKDFIRFTKSDLGIKTIPKINLLYKRPNGVTTGGYMPGADIICIIKNRHLVDIMRSIAHELVHHWQWENGRIRGEVQNIGGEIEDEANAIAGQLIKKYAKAGNDDIYEHVKKDKKLICEGIEKAFANDPRFLQWLNDIIKQTERLGDQPILYRGFNAGKTSTPIIRVTEDREGFRGAKPEVVDFMNKVKTDKGFQSNVPTFVTPDRKKAAFFGNPTIYVPTGNYKIYQSELIDDILVDIEKITPENESEYIDSYKPDTFNYDVYGELIADSSEYFLLQNNFISNLPNKFQIEPTTYKDINSLAKKWRWLVQKQYGEENLNEVNAEKLRNMIKEEIQLVLAENSK